MCGAAAGHSTVASFMKDDILSLLDPDLSFLMLIITQLINNLQVHSCVCQRGSGHMSDVSYVTSG